MNQYTDNHTLQFAGTPYGNIMYLVNCSDRMIELGFPQAEGIYCYVDGVRIPDHCCSKPWEQGVTYSISASGAARLMAESKRFSFLVSSGAYLYINGHFCRNSDAYLGRTKIGAFYMNTYAKEHMEECCLAFKVCAVSRDEDYQFGLVSRKNTLNGKKYQVDYTMVAEVGTEMYVRENTNIAYGSFAWGDLYRRLPNDFEGAVRLILDEFELTQEALAFDLGVDRKAIYRMLTAERSGGKDR